MAQDDLLRRYNPLLVILPRDPERHRPGSGWSEEVFQPRGDYHPCTAHLFLSLVAHRPAPKPWRPFFWSEPALPSPLGLEELRRLVGGAGSGGTAGWELDIAPIQSQRPEQAWSAYGRLLLSRADEFEPVVYGRYVPGPPAILEYWYLYLYNDAPNKHEGDWEMVMLELGASGEPVRAGYSGHGGGFQRPWSRVEKQGERPLVYVARGSHAAYFDHKPGGHRTNSLKTSKGWPMPFDLVWSGLVSVATSSMSVLRLVDHTPAKPNEAAATSDDGVIIDARLLPLPEEPDPADDARWWRAIDCGWGSRHSRLTGFAGPPPPWLQESKWRRPHDWLAACRPD
jgi:hypothetical protein